MTFFDALLSAAMVQQTIVIEKQVEQLVVANAAAAGDLERFRRRTNP